MELFLPIGILMLLALGGVYLAHRYGQSSILAYIIIGVLIGPNLPIDIGGLSYHGIFTSEDQHVIELLLEISLIFLFFFVGFVFLAAMSTQGPDQPLGQHGLQR